MEQPFFGKAQLVSTKILNPFSKIIQFLASPLIGFSIGYEQCTHLGASFYVPSLYPYTSSPYTNLLMNRCGR